MQMTAQILSLMSFCSNSVSLKTKTLEPTDDFIGLGWFVKTHLVGQGYAINSSYGIANALDKKGLVEIYQVDNIKGGHSVTAIRLADSEG